MTATNADTAQSTAFVEKAPLERYVPPAKPSLVGLSRAALAEALGAIGVPAAQRKMRVQQLWHWIYVRGARRFDQMSNVSKELHATLDAHFTLARPEGDRVVSNIVMMGMGEPLYNFEAVRDAIQVIADGEGIAISKRRITLSTSGVVPMIARAGAEIGCMLAVSLHAVRDELRNELVPLNRKYPIEQLLEACRNYPGLSNARRITFEYVMLKDVNDSLADAKALVQLLRGIPAKINLIPFNPWPGTRYECSDWETIEKFSEVIFNAGYASPVRTPLRRYILAACGQLKSASEKLSARERLALRAMAMTD